MRGPRAVAHEDLAATVIHREIRRLRRCLHSRSSVTFSASESKPIRHKTLRSVS